MGTNVTGSSNAPITPPITQNESNLDSIAESSKQTAAPLLKDPPPDPVADAKATKGSKQNATTKKKDQDLQGNVLRDSLNKKLPGKTKTKPEIDLSKIDLTKIKDEKKTDFGPDIQNITKDIIKTPQEKVEATRKMLVSAGKEDLQKIIKDSEKWPEDSKRVLTEAMRSPDVMSRIAKEFPTDQSLKALDRAVNPKEGFPEASNAQLKTNQDVARNVAMSVWMKDAPADAVNQALKTHREPMAKLIGYQLESKDYSTFDKLHVGTKAFVFNILTTDPSADARSARQAFNRLEAQEKNEVFNALQAMGPHVLPDFLSRFSKEKSVDHQFLDGLDKDNVRFMRETYLALADGAKTKEDADIYRQTALYLKGWMEDRMK